MTTFAYLRVSTTEQTIENQRQAIAQVYTVERWFEDEGVSGLVEASQRPAMQQVLEYLREGDRLIVTAIDRLGRNTVDVLKTVQTLQAKGVSVVSMREGFDLSTPIGKAMLTMLSAVAELEVANLKERQLAGIKRAKAEGKHMGRPKTVDMQAIAKWKADNQASIKTTAEFFGVGTTTVKNAMKLSKS